MDQIILIGENWMLHVGQFSSSCWNFSTPIIVWCYSFWYNIGVHRQKSVIVKYSKKWNY
jgi:hypothetical protein